MAAAPRLDNFRSYARRSQRAAPFSLDASRLLCRRGGSLLAGLGAQLQSGSPTAARFASGRIQPACGAELVRRHFSGDGQGIQGNIGLRNSIRGSTILHGHAGGAGAVVRPRWMAVVEIAATGFESSAWRSGSIRRDAAVSPDVGGAEQTRHRETTMADAVRIRARFAGAGHFGAGIGSDGCL